MLSHYSNDSNIYIDYAVAKILRDKLFTSVKSFCSII